LYYIFAHKITHFFLKTAIFDAKSSENCSKMHFFKKKIKKVREKFG